MEDSQKTISNDVSSAARAGVSAARTAISVGKAAGKAAAGDVAGAAIELAKDENIRKIILVIVCISFFLNVVIFFAVPLALYEGIIGISQVIAEKWEEVKYSYNDGNFFSACSAIFNGSIDTLKEIGGAIANIWNSVFASQTKNDEVDTDKDPLTDNDMKVLGGIALLKALLLYTILFKEIPEKDKNIGTINLLLQGAGMSDLEDKFNYASCVQPDEMKPAISAFNTFKQASPNLYGNIIAHVASGIQIIQTSMVERILTTDDIDLNLPGDKPCAYFCRFSATNNTFRFVSAMFFSMLFIALIEHADQQDTKRLKNEVHFLMDEFPSIGVIPDWLEKISNIRSYGITAVMIVQGITQIQNNYGDASTMIIGNCGTILNIGMNDEETAKWFQTRIGVTSIKVETQRIDNPGRAMTTIGSTSAGVGKDFLYPVSDIYQMPVDDVLIVFQHCSPIYAHKVPITAFPEFHKYPKASENDIPDITDFQARQRERVLEEKRIAEYNRKHPYKPVKPAPSNEKPVVFFGMTTLQVFLVVVKDDIRLAWEKIGYFACVLLASLKHFAFRVQDNDSQNVTPDTTEEAEKEDPPSPLLQFSFELPEFEPSSNENVSQGTQQAAQAEKASPPSPPPHPSQSSDKQIAVTGKNSPNETGTSNNTPEPSQRVQRPKSNLLGGMPVKRTHN